MIYVFKTSVAQTKQIDRLQPILDQLVHPGKWSFDLEDCDHILRVESDQDVSQKVENALRKWNYDCLELVD